DQTRSGNGKSYEIDGGVPLSTNKSVYATLKNNSEYSRFFDLISGGDDDNPDENLMVNLIDKKYSCVDYNIRLFNAYNYTVWVPTNASIEKLHEEGILPYWSDFEAQTAAAWGNDNEKATKMKTIIKNRIMNFLKYHIQDNSVYVGGETISGNNYETSVMNQTNHKYYTLTVNSDNSNLTVKDILGDTRSVVKTSGAYNNMCREYLYNNTDKESAYNSTLYSSSYAVVHLIDGPLLYDKMTPMSFIPGGTQAKKFYAKRRNTKR
nr:fasciclin domain-containing protein [Prevotella sp.]